MKVQKVQANGLEFTYLEWGLRTGPLAVLVHGFPDSPLTWRHLGPALAEDGFHVIAPWTRGYAPTEVPTSRATSPSTLAADINELREVLGDSRDAVLVGHDWGAIAGYRAVSAAHGRWRRMVGLAVPPEPSVSLGSLRPAQARMSSYAVRFQLPGAERSLRRKKHEMVRKLWREWSPDYEATQDDLQPFIDATSTPEGATAVLSYYRGLGKAIVMGSAYRPDSPRPYRPMMYLHGEDDGCVGVDLARAAQANLTDAETEILDGVGHFLHLEDPGGVNRRIREFLAA